MLREYPTTALTTCVMRPLQDPLSRTLIWNAVVEQSPMKNSNLVMKTMMQTDRRDVKVKARMGISPNKKPHT